MSKPTVDEAEQVQRDEGKVPCHMRTLGLMGAPGWVKWADDSPLYCERIDTAVDTSCSCCAQCCSCGG